MEITVAICSNGNEFLQKTLQSIYNQTTKPVEILVIMDTDVSGVHYPFVRFVQNRGIGLSAARNTALDIARGDIVAFIDDDAYADKDWLCCLLNEYIRGASIVGGKVVPMYEGTKEIPSGLNWLIGCTFDTTRLIGCNFSLLKDVGFRFNEHMGKVGGGGVVGEETELIERARKLGYPIVYTKYAVVYHKVPEYRTRIMYMLRRAYYEGISKSRIGRGHDDSKWAGIYLKSFDPLTYCVLGMTTIGYIIGRIRL